MGSFQGLIDSQEASELLRENDVAASDLVAGRYEGGTGSYRMLFVLRIMKAILNPSVSVG